MPAVSVIMPVFNAGPYMAQAIESILAQTLGDFELVIVDDGSQDASRDIAASYHDPRVVVVTHTQNLGLSTSLNDGIARATGAYLARQDADDLSHPDRLRQQVAYLEEHHDVALVGTRVQWIDRDGHRLRLSSIAPTCLSIRWGHLFHAAGISGATAVCRREIAAEVGPYDPAFRYANDAEWHSRVARRFRVACLAEPLYLARIHEQQITTTYGDVPAREADRITLRNTLELLHAAGERRSAWETGVEDLLALRALYTLAPSRVGRLTPARTGRILLALLRSFQRVYPADPAEWDEFCAWLSRDWLRIANVHLRARPHMAAWLWWAAVRLRRAHLAHPLSMRLLAKLAVYPVYKAVTWQQQTLQ
jgi:glycosyltransferase involved in cell wall biosynthesis